MNQRANPERPLLPVELAGLLRASRERAMLSLEETARLSGVPVDVIEKLESGQPTGFAKPRHLLRALELLAPCLHLSPAEVVDATLDAWASTYAGPAPLDQPAPDYGSEPLTTQLRTLDPPTAQIQAQSSLSSDLASVADTGVARILANDGTPTSAQAPADWVGSSTRSGESRPLLIALWLVGATLVCGLALLGAAQGGAFRHGGGSAPRTRALTRPPATAVTQLLTPGSQSGAAATYTVAASQYTVTVTASKPTWVEVSVGSQPPVFAKTISEGTPQAFNEEGAVAVQVGAGGVSIAVSAAGKQVTLTPPQAPFTFNFTSGSGG